MRLYPIMADLIRVNKLAEKRYLEPYAGGAGLALKLLIHEHVWEIHINDLDPAIYALWNAVLKHTDALCRLVEKTPASVKAWHQQRAVYRNPENHSAVEFGFATLFLNRTNRSGIIHSGGMIGGKRQNGAWRIDARYNPPQLVKQIQSIANYRSRITLTNLDALTLLRDVGKQESADLLVYLDPPYYGGGSELYRNWYTDRDHAKISDHLLKHARYDWFLTYDHHPKARSLYKGQNLRILNLFHTANKHRYSRELFIAAPHLNLPQSTFVNKRRHTTDTMC